MFSYTLYVQCLTIVDVGFTDCRYQRSESKRSDLHGASRNPQSSYDGYL